MSKPLIAIMSCHRQGNVLKTVAQWATWGQRLLPFADVVVFRGKAEGIAPTNEVWLDCPDDYAGIPLKVQAICRWASERGYKRLAKVDDDVFIVPGRYVALPTNGEYIGRFRAPYGKYPVHFASGFFYQLGGPAIKLVAAQLWNGDWMDERWISSTLAHHGIFGKHDPTNYVVSGPFIKPQDIPNRVVIRDGTAFCQYGPAEIEEMWRYMGGANPVGKSKLVDVPRAKVSAELLMSPPDDRIPEEKLKRYAR